MSLRLLAAGGCLLLLLFGGSSWSADSSVKHPADNSDERISGMKKILNRIAAELGQAKKTDDIHRINCLTTKLNLVKGLIKASQRAQMSLVDAAANQDAATVRSYTQKISTYGDSVDDIAKSISECLPTEGLPEGMALVYIRPEEPELVPEEVNPWEAEGTIGGGEGIPVIPPMSPFR